MSSQKIKGFASAIFLVRGEISRWAALRTKGGYQIVVVTFVEEMAISPVQSVMEDIHMLLFTALPQTPFTI